MEKNKEINENIAIGHNITINERKNIVINGVKKINSFDDSEFYIDTIMGPMIIKGINLELSNLDTYTGKLSIKGKIISLIYLEDGKKIKKENMLSRLFK